MSGPIVQLALVALILVTPPTIAPKSQAEDELSWPPESNPAQLLITPRKGQTAAEQMADQWQCYDEISEQLQWDPYHAYDALVAEGYAVALSRREMERGLIFLASDGAEVGAVAGDLVGHDHGRSRRGAEIGVALTIAGELIKSQYLLQEESPETRRVVTRYERELRKWVRKYSACLSRLGYRVDSSLYSLNF